MNYSNPFVAMLFRDLRIAFRQRAEIMLPVIFFVVVVSLFPLAISPDPAVLRSIGPGVIWIAALLSILLFCEPAHVSAAANANSVTHIWPTLKETETKPTQRLKPASLLHPNAL